MVKLTEQVRKDPVGGEIAAVQGEQIINNIDLLTYLRRLKSTFVTCSEAMAADPKTKGKLFIGNEDGTYIPYDGSPLPPIMEAPKPGEMKILIRG